MNNIGGLKKMGAIDPKGGVIKDSPDHAGGYVESGPTGKSVPLAKGGNAKSAMIDGPYGGKVKA